jgi:hypothetical protein
VGKGTSTVDEGGGGGRACDQEVAVGEGVAAGHLDVVLRRHLPSPSGPRHSALRAPTKG